MRVIISVKPKTKISYVSQPVRSVEVYIITPTDSQNILIPLRIS